MSKLLSRMLLLPAVMLGIASEDLQADVKLPAVLDSHMVLQRDQPVAVWGWADAGEEVTVSFRGKSATTTANADGKWEVELPAMGAEKSPNSLVVKGKNTITLEDVLVGDVWLGSGQSNMEWTIAISGEPEKTAAGANHPNVRLFQIPKVESQEPNEDVNAKWMTCTPEHALHFSAVLYHFGARLNKDLDIPIGLINSSWGGSPIEPWTIKDGKAGGMYNAMIAPVTKFPIKGVIWYQGETNAMQKNGLAYFDKKVDLISGWRKAWNNELPFYFVQIAPLDGAYEGDDLPRLWEAQVKSLSIPGTGMAVTTDIGDLSDIHPKNKYEVGNRLARWALTKTYGKEGIVYSGPLFKSVTFDGNKAIIEFAHTAEGLKSRDGKPLNEFKIAGEDGKFFDAVAEIDGHKVIVSSSEVSDPTQVQFGWHRACDPNLMNTAGLPASPFQSKDWQGATGE
ncbi:sialate O-acetylesterase [Planctomicrobium sp. SH668]|uniref:sialate O-acetylesterase n=1 Tax=Planctomicrobium sp. SH668 TaxID=3448126 RepID=UPI003F5C658D